MINSSGGMTGGDRLNWTFELHDHTALTVTSQACERVYAATTDTAKTDIAISVGKGAKLAWLPQETILFNQGSFARHLEVDLAVGAELLLIEPIIFGRGAMNEVVSHGHLKDRWRIRRGDRLIHAEDALFCGNIHQKLQSDWVSGGRVAVANILLIAPRAEGLCAAARQIIEGSGAASFWQDKLLIRLMATDSYELRKKLAPLINLLNNSTPLPKIWTL
ncbi:MAG: urease accessory protein UreD [Rhizobiaceae bacterium]